MVELARLLDFVQKLVLIGCWRELGVNDLERVTNLVVRFVERPEASQDRVVDALGEQHPVKRVVSLVVARLLQSRMDDLLARGRGVSTATLYV